MKEDKDKPDKNLSQAILHTVSNVKAEGHELVWDHAGEVLGERYKNGKLLSILALKVLPEALSNKEKDKQILALMLY